MAKIWKEGQKKETPEEKQARLNHNETWLKMPYEAKVQRAEIMVRDWQTTCWKYDKDYAVSVGGLDSITLLTFVREILGPETVGVSCSSLEDKTIQAVHKELNVVNVKPIKSKVQVLKEYGYPIISKQIAAKISRLQTPGDDSPIIKAYMTGDEGAWGHYGHNEKFKIPDTYLKLFGGLYQEFRPDIDCKIAPFKVSDQCCYWLKELPLAKWQEENNVWPFLGLMQSEGGRRAYSLRMHGCNYVGKDTARSCPFNFFTRQDLLQLAVDLNVHVPEIYGEIVKDPDGTLRTTGAQRTGCGMCGFGIQMEKRPNRFDKLYQRNPKEWEFWMIDQGWGKVLDYIGVEWRQETLIEQIEMDFSERMQGGVKP